MARRQVSIFINGKEVANTLKGIRNEKRKVTRELNNMTLGTDEYKAKVKELARLNGLLTEHRNKIRGVGGAWSKIQGAVGKFGAAAGVAFGADMLIDYGKELFKTSTAMETLQKKAKTIFGEALPLVTAEAQKNAHAMGLTTGQYTNAAAAIGDLLIPMGFHRDEAANMSTGLVNLSGALSEWTGGQLEAADVTKILGKAMLGEREELKQLGISINEADVKARLAKKGLSSLTGEMLQQAKAAATLELINERSGDAQAAYAKNSKSLVRTQAELSAKFAEIQDKLANALIPVFGRLMDFIVPVADVLSETVDVLADGKQPVGDFAGVVLYLSNTIKSTLGFFKSFWTAGKAIVKLFKGDWKGAFLTAQLASVQFFNSIIGRVNSFLGLFGENVQIDLVDTTKLEASIAAMEDTKDKQDEVLNTMAGTQGKFDREALQRQAAQDEKQAKAREKAAKKEVKDLQKKQAKLREVIANFREENRLDQLSEDDRKLEELRLKYDKQIALAAELEAKGFNGATEQKLALERLREEALSNLRAELFEAEMQQLSEQEDAETQQILAKRLEREEAKRAADEAINAQIREVLFTERQQALFELEAHYEQLRQLAEQNGIDLTSLEIAYRREKAAVNEEFDKTDLAEINKSQTDRAKALQKGFSDMSSVISAALNAIGNEGEKFKNLQKALTLAQIGIDTAQAISALTANSAKNPANSVTFGAAGAAQFATGLIQIFANMAQARQVLSQKKHGGYHNVIGEDDGITYNAQYIGTQATGMLPNRPVVLASEAGAEYFVSHADLQKPVVANYVRMIDNISKGRAMPQYAEGGFTAGTAPAGQQQDNTATLLLAKEIGRLNSNLEQGIQATIDDDTIIGIRNQYNSLNASSGGALDN